VAVLVVIAVLAVLVVIWAPGQRQEVVLAAGELVSWAKAPAEQAAQPVLLTLLLPEAVLVLAVLAAVDRDLRLI
jgi:hypothetical protein